MEIFDNAQQLSQYSDNIPTLPPALRWAQSINDTFIEVKFSTRWDSPACLDLFDRTITIENSKILTISAMCRNVSPF